MFASRRRIAAVAVGIGLFAAAGFAEARSQGFDAARLWKWRASIGFDYLSRTIGWDEKARSSTLAAPSLVAGLELRAIRGLRVSALAGYGLSNWNGLVFRALPFSIDYQAGSAGGVLLGAGVEADLFSRGNWEVGASARLTASLGATKTTALDMLNEPGTLDGKGAWLRLQAGPRLTYRGFEAFSPFVGASYDKLWGSFTLDETVKDLSGTEKKKIASRGFVAGSGGVIWEPRLGFALRLEGSLLPFRKLGGGLGFDLGAAVSGAYSF
jgi:hypothetical protein